MPVRHDYAFPFRIDASSKQAARAGYEAHVEQMIRQVLFTAPGERVNLPEFGCGVRQLVFAPQSEPLRATAELRIYQSLNRWLSTDIRVETVVVRFGAQQDSGGLDPGAVEVVVSYTLIDSLAARQVRVEVGAR